MCDLNGKSNDFITRSFTCLSNSQQRRFWLAQQEIGDVIVGNRQGRHKRRELPVAREEPVVEHLDQ